MAEYLRYQILTINFEILIISERAFQSLFFAPKTKNELRIFLDYNININSTTVLNFYDNYKNRSNSWPKVALK